MKELINKIFDEYQYELVESRSDKEFSFQLKDKKKSDFYICYFCDEKEDIKEISDRIEASFATDTYYSTNESNSSIAKNTSVIYLVMAEDIVDYEEQNQNKIYDIEESPYFLKKFVLVYNPTQVQEFNTFLPKIESVGSYTIKEKMTDIISDDGAYKMSGKKNIEASLYTFVLKLYAKIPFTIYDVLPEPKIKETMSSIETSIEAQTEDLVGQLFSDYNQGEWSEERLESIAKKIDITDEDINDYIKIQMSKLEENIQ